MIKVVIALAPGQSGFYDELSGVHLTLMNKEASINAGVNTAGLVNAVRAGKIIIVSGSLGSETFSSKKEVAMPSYYRLRKTQRNHRASEPVKIEEVKPMQEEILAVIEEEVPAVVEEQVTEPVVEEVKVETKPAKRKRKNKNKPSQEVVEETSREE